MPERARPRSTPSKQRRRGPRRSFVWRYRRVWFVIGVLGLAAISGVGFVLSQVPLPEAEPPVETSFMYDAHGRKLADLSGGENRQSVPLDQVSPTMIEAVLAAEDRDFFEHPGVDLTAIARAGIADLRGERLQGGSTITQQYVKQTYTDKERSLSRKVKEAVLSIKLERELDKEEILERYLNTIYFGRGAHGVQAAARAYFAKDAIELDVGQSALLAGLIRGPEAADPTTHAVEASQRRGNVLRLMEKAHFITGAERDAAALVPMELLARPRPEAVRDKYVGAESGTPYFVAHAYKELGRLGFSDAQIYGGGLRIHTSLDLDLQAEAYKSLYTDTLNQTGDPSGALVAVDTDGYVRAMVGGRDWESDVEWAKVNLATGADGGGTGRQAGSSFKTFTLAAAVANGYSVNSVLPAPASITFPGRNNGDDYVVGNYSDRDYGSIDLVEATEQSVNTVYAQMLDTLGEQRVADMAERLGITTEVDPVLSMVLGTPDVSVLDMADAYLTFATRGMQVEPSVIVRVEDADGEVLYEHRPVSERVLDPEDADIVTAVLEGVVNEGTGTRAKLAVPAAGKTGTTNDNGDAWFVGYTAKLSTAVWIGYPEGREHHMDRVHGGPVTGGTLPAQAWQRFMAVAVKDQRWAGEFTAPDDLARGRVLQSKISPLTPTTTTTVRTTTTVTSTTAPSTTTTSTAPTTTTSTSTTTSTTLHPPSG
jgi:penicillin-binding protein 1A